MKNILLTGAAGFIGMETAKKLLGEGFSVVGIDNLNDYYDVRLKTKRLEELAGNKNFVFYKIDIENFQDLKNLFSENKFDAVINLAARAGVRYSIENPFIYVTTNTLGNTNLLELSKHYGVSKFVLASTSSLYAGQKMPFVETLEVNTPISPYAASKKGAEMMCYTYHYLFGLDTTILRFFTVYGPYGRPDMSVFKFFKWITEDKPVEIYGDGSQSRDFTYVEDIARGVVSGLKPLGFEIINFGNNSPHKLSEMLELIEKFTGKKSVKEYSEFRKEDMMATYADITKAKKLLDWSPEYSLEQGIEETAKWWRENQNWLADIKI
ncbi:SDR family NAD(P)-dependent oxidoreductase [candidate division WOR-3 bacterium]|nr:SDR family NAD(P)-dependent oxidoreductase [candidate division WOR-3 bacterium]